MKESLSKQLHDLIDTKKFYLESVISNEMNELEENVQKLIENENQETPNNT